MEYITEAKKFIQRAENADSPEVIKTDLEMAEWFLSRAIEELEQMPSQGPRRASHTRISS
jgi:hypothetical protein